MAMKCAVDKFTKPLHLSVKVLYYRLVIIIIVIIKQFNLNGIPGHPRSQWFSGTRKTMDFTTHGSDDISI